MRHIEQTEQRSTLKVIVDVTLVPFPLGKLKLAGDDKSQQARHQITGYHRIKGKAR